MRLLLADDHNLFREAICYYLRQCADDIEILEASDLDGAMAAARRSRPDVILLDFAMPGMDGIKGIERAKREFPDTPIVILSGHITQPESNAALRSGAVSVISKELSADELKAALARILPGQSIGAAADRGQPPSAQADVARFGLTPRELDVVRLLVRGMADKMMAHELGIAAVTVRLHLYNAFRKLGARNRVDAVRIALQAGITG